MAEYYISGDIDACGNFTPHPIHGEVTYLPGDTIHLIALDIGDTFTIPPPEPKWWERPLIALRLRKPRPFRFKVTGIVTAPK